MTEINQHIEDIKELCRKHRVRSLFVFGSTASSKSNVHSDIDLVVDIEDDDPFSYSDHYTNLKSQLEALLGKKIDLLEEKALNNPFLKKEIDQSKKLIYAG